jgi:hypothetical protein
LVTERKPKDAARRDLYADCERCVGLCCIAPALTSSADFAIDKAAGQPCPNLDSACRCTIHDSLLQRGFRGCVAYDCFGAGQWVAERIARGRKATGSSRTAQRSFSIFAVVRQLHELRWYLTEAIDLPVTRPIQRDLRGLLAQTIQLGRSDARAMLRMDVAEHRACVDALLQRASELARSPVEGRKSRRRADLVGAKLRGRDLRSVDLRGALLLGADLRDADLRLADLIGADLRGADLRGADLGTSLFLTPMQIAGARGDAGTKLPPWLRRPAHWSAESPRVSADVGRRRLKVVL